MSRKNCKFDCEQIVKIVESILDKSETILSLSKKLGVSRMMIYKIVYQKSYAHCKDKLHAKFGYFEDELKEILHNNRRKR